MILYALKPFKECGPIVAGISFSKVQKLFADHRVFNKGENHVTSLILDQSMHVYYNEHGICTGVEVMSPFLPGHNYQLVWNGINFLNESLDNIIKLLKKRGCIIEIIDTGANIPELGLSLYSDEYETDLHCNIDAVYVELSKSVVSRPTVR